MEEYFKYKNNHKQFNNLTDEKNPEYFRLNKYEKSMILKNYYCC